MIALADRPAQGQLRHKAEHVRALIAPLHERPASAPGEVDVETARAIRTQAYGRLEDAILDLSNALPQGTEDYDARKLFEFLVGLRRAIDADPGARDERGEVELHTMMLRDVLPRIGAGDLARLLGVSTKTVGAWKAGRPVTRNGERVVVLAQLLSYLRPSL